MRSKKPLASILTVALLSAPLSQIRAGDPAQEVINRQLTEVIMQQAELIRDGHQRQDHHEEDLRNLKQLTYQPRFLRNQG